MKEKKYDENYLSHSIDVTKRRKNRKLEIIVEENNSISHDINNADMPGLKTQENKYNNYNRLKHSDNLENKDNFDRKRKNNDWIGKKRQISNYSQNFENSDEEESEEKEFYKIEDNSDKKRRNQKVSQNLQLLKLIKERFNNSGKKEKEKEKEEKSQEKKEKEIYEEKNDDGYNNNNEKNGCINQRKKYLKRKGFASFIINKKNDDDIKSEKTDTKITENQNKIYNKFKKREIDNPFKEEEQKEENSKLKKSKSKRIINSNEKITHSVVSSVSYSSIIRKGVGNFQISRPKLKSDSRKKEEKAREEEAKDEQIIESKYKNKNKTEDKYTEITEISNEQKDKLTINIKSKNINSMNDVNNSGKKSYQKNISNKRNNYAYDRDDDDINENDDKPNNNNDNNDSNNNGSEYYEYNKEGYQIKKTSHKFKEIDKKNMNKRTNMQENNNDDSPNKLNQKSINPNKSNFNSSSKKDFALKILEILKAKKREKQNKNELRAKSQDIPLKQDKSNKNSCNEDENEENKIKDKGDIQKAKINKIESDYSNFSNQKANKNYAEGKFDSNSLPKKTFREEEEEFKKDYKYQESNYKVQTPDSYMKENYNRIENRKNHINMNRSMNLNKYLDFEEAQNGREKRFSNYIINSSSLRTKYNKKIKESNKTNDSSSINKSYEPKNFDTQNTTIVKSNYNIKSLDKSFDNAISRKSPISKRILNMNNNNNNNDKYNSIKLTSNSGVYEHKKISSPSNERNLNNELNCMNSMKNINKKVYNRMNNNNAYMAYVKKSPGRFKRAIQNNFDNNENNKNEKNYNLKNNLYKNYIDNNISNNNLNTKFSNNKNSITGLLEVSSIDKFNTSKDTCTSNTIDYFNYNYIDKKNKINNNKNNLADMSQRESSMMFNLEDLMVLEERLSDINIALQSNNNIESKCFNFWNYYYNCSLYKIIEKIFPNEEDSNIVRLSINYALMSIMVCYEFSFHAYITYEDMYLQLLDLINLNHNNLMIICEYILTKISPENKKNVWVTKLQELVNNLKISQVKELNNNYSLPSIQKINKNTKNLIPKIKNLLRNYTTEFSPFLKKFLNTLESKSYEEINEFFRLNILRVNNFEGSIVASSYLKENKNFEPVPAPYITEPSKKKYTLVLDLDETLVNFKIKSTKEGMLRARPFLFGFLEEMGVYYELIIWTSATETYANTLLDAIESEKTYFDYVFYREHAIIVGDDFVKDLTRIGRPLDKIIIVDDMPQNFRLQRQNGITIKPFLGDDNTDMALYDLLPILKHIAEEGNDVRVELAKYRDEIVKKITSNISKHNI